MRLMHIEQLLNSNVTYRPPTDHNIGGAPHSQPRRLVRVPLVSHTRVPRVRQAELPQQTRPQASRPARHKVRNDLQIQQGGQL